MPPRLRLLLALVLVQLPWLARPPHYDEANFLRLAAGAAADPWRPHAISINWQGTTEAAFAVLSNPPGIAWWLAPWVEAPVWAQRMVMLPWLVLSLLGAWSLGERFQGGGARGALVLLTSPIVILSTAALLPDAPLLACTLAGVGGFVGAVDRGGRAWPWALLAGCAALFRYSGLALAPLLAVYAMRHGRAPWVALWAWVPLVLLGAHDLHAYGDWHLRVMFGFQAVATTPGDWLHKAAAAVAMLGGAAAIPLFRWRPSLVVGAAFGAALAAPFGALGAAFGALGGAALGAGSLRDEDGRFLATWAAGGLLFLVALRFVATRYWLPFLPGVLLAFPRDRRVGWAVALQGTLGLGLLADDAFSAAAQVTLADAAARVGPPGVYTGHWGWQHAMEARGWTALDEGRRAPPGALVALPRQAWPQPVDVPCSEVIWSGVARPPMPWLPRGYSEAGHANLHANWIAPGTRTVAPWTFANDPYERVRVCRDPSPPAAEEAQREEEGG